MKYSINRNLTNNVEAFTLAEVLIALGIIGIVASMTIPTLIQKQQEREWITGTKAAYSMLSQAYKLAENENGDPTQWQLDDSDAVVFKILKPYLKVAKDCNVHYYYAPSNNCWPVPTYMLSGGNGGFENSYTLSLANGMSIKDSYLASSACSSEYGTSNVLKNVCSEIFVDINGHKGPNVVGKDTHAFLLTKYGIVPAGGPDLTDANFIFKGRCVSADGASLGAGSACAAWIINNGNMDYLKSCRSTLGWDGASSCD